MSFSILCILCVVVYLCVLCILCVLFYPLCPLSPLCPSYMKDFASSFFDRGHRECVMFCALATLLVLVRSFVPPYYEGFYFDSDQAIVGLMAKHLADLRGFPLFYYGLNYMLGVEAWIIAPFFWIARPSVAVLRVPLIALDVLV